MLLFFFFKYCFGFRYCRWSHWSIMERIKLQDSALNGSLILLMYFGDWRRRKCQIPKRLYVYNVKCNVFKTKSLVRGVHMCVHMVWRLFLCTKRKKEICRKQVFIWYLGFEFAVWFFLQIFSLALVLEWLCTQCRPHGLCCDCREDSQQLNDNLWIETSLRELPLYESSCGWVLRYSFRGRMWEGMNLFFLKVCRKWSLNTPKDLGGKRHDFSPCLSHFSS